MVTTLKKARAIRPRNFRHMTVGEIPLGVKDGVLDERISEQKNEKKFTENGVNKLYRLESLEMRGRA